MAAVALAGCGGTTAPANTPSLSASPDSAAGSLEPSANASPTPDQVAQASQAYLALATRLNAATADLGTLSPTATLAQVKAYYTSLAAIHADGVTSIQAISFPTRFRDDVENLVRATNAVRSAEVNIAASTSLAEASARSTGLASAFDAMGQAANTLRAHLGLPAVPAPAPPPTPRLSPTPSAAASSIDPADSLRIAAPYTLEPPDAALIAQFQAQLKIALGSLASSFRFGVRWVKQGTEQVALVIDMQVPGAGSAIATPAFLDQISAGMAGVSADTVVGTTILGVPVRTVQKSGVPIAVYAQDEGVVIVVGVLGMTPDSLATIVMALIRARS